MAEADPQKTFNVHDAKTHLSRLMDRAHAGEEIILAKAGVPYAKLVPVDPVDLPPRKPGRFKGEFDGIPDSVWFDPFYSDEELDAFACEFADEPKT
ncbi:type II toxin-antitoxin system prevent-host-death family antitoxin [Sphingomonas cannabina]|uniref:type II toxin-antitoxin system Phd/YefM family antitoxin n=1 Tax=Sphingomonas cannabina TaxID=2899123 RepID=UPI001F2F51E3|nr:type II toxin-antitoxin system prevent-host-death family antitoxin [Sphingomonas cannabina]UIJ44635.1 type II toxin-antitoxin system prevent-host-death family antitoxin [Sphingomonas cannabina]